MNKLIKILIKIHKIISTKLQLKQKKGVPKTNLLMIEIILADAESLT